MDKTKARKALAELFQVTEDLLKLRHRVAAIRGTPVAALEDDTPKPKQKEKKP